MDLSSRTGEILTWFYNPTQWISLLKHEKSKFPHPQTCWIEVHRSLRYNKPVKQAFAHLFFIFTFHMPFKASVDNLVMSFPQAAIYKTLTYSLYENPLDNLLGPCKKQCVSRITLFRMKYGPKEQILMKKLNMTFMTLNILLISMTCKCNTKTKNSSK